jgi:pimeloyl-ACP methyl ester carboxylesterase
MVRTVQRYHRPGILSEEEIAEYSLTYRDGEGKRAFWHIVREGLGPEVAARLPATLAAVATPTLLIWAKNDTLIPPETGPRWQQAIAGSQLRWVEESSHFPHVEWPEQTVAMVEAFLKA